MNISSSGYLPFISLIGKITLFIYLLSAFAGGHSMNYVRPSVLFLFLLFELFNTIIFIYLISYNVKTQNRLRDPFIKSKQDQIDDENIRKIVSQILLEEIQNESLINSEELKLKVLIHEAKIRTGYKELEQLKK
jgi:hypothetical protein